MYPFLAQEGVTLATPKSNKKDHPKFNWTNEKHSCTRTLTPLDEGRLTALLLFLWIDKWCEKFEDPFNLVWILKGFGKALLW